MQLSGCWLFCRHADPPAPLVDRRTSALVLLNFSDQPIDLHLSSAGAGARMLESRLQDRVTGEYFATSASKPLRLEPFAARILTPDVDPCG